MIPISKGQLMPSFVTQAEEFEPDPNKTDIRIEVLGHDSRIGS